MAQTPLCRFLGQQIHNIHVVGLVINTTSGAPTRRRTCCTTNQNNGIWALVNTPPIVAKQAGTPFRPT